ncbi:hypothetical protein EIP91_010327 [Steccherinum ochraceum]|uniref:Uncharacterized protein n=1 Tax=Steccherinum ochraceum TaxID=92696 RepID=A0A4R0R3B8_9APHY|nr:hypothetical protein EIP91_010327 [Steccherinum ochraceum]
MIHVDRNHATSISPHTTSNLILDNSPSSDQHSALSWSGPDHDGVPFYQEPEQHHDVPPTPLEPTAHNSTASSSEARPVTSPRANAPQDKASEDTSLEADAADSPSAGATASPGPANSTSPALQSTSSLTPPPDTTSPTSPTRAADADSKTSQTEDPELAAAVGDSDELEKASRASTPLSELSSAPEGDDQPISHFKDRGEEGRSSIGDGGTENPATVAPAVANGAEVGQQTVVQTVGTEAVPAPAPSMPSRTSNSDFAKALQSGIINGVEQPTGRVDTQFHSGARPNPKVVAILELNTHLLRVFMECQAHKVSVMDPRCQEYSARLQSNLTWLAAAADEGRRVSLSQIALPNMQPPPAMDFISTERIKQIYAELPMLFQKDLLRRDQGNATAPLKRDRTDESLSSAAMRQQSQQRAASQQKMPQNGFGQGPLPSLPPASASTPPMNSSSARVSPTSVAFPHSTQSVAGTLDQRPTMNTLSAQQHAQLASLNPQQRQLYLMQQHLLRTAGGGPQSTNIQNAPPLSGQERARALSASSPSHTPLPSHSSGLTGLDSSSFSAMKSHGMMPGGSRHSTPSDGGITSMTPHLQRSHSHLSDDFSGVVTPQQLQQQGMTHAQNLASYSGGGGSTGPSWSPHSVQHNQAPFGMTIPQPDIASTAPFAGVGGPVTSGSPWGSRSPDTLPGLSQAPSMMGLQHGLGEESSAADIESMFDWGQ